MKRRGKKALNRSHYAFSKIMVTLRDNTKFQKKFHKWYMSGSNIVPCKIYDYIMEKYHKKLKIDIKKEAKAQL